MSRLERKCMVASAVSHAVLMLVVIVGPAFLVAKKPADNLPILKVIPNRLTDEAMFGGGNPLAKPPTTPGFETPKAVPPPAPVPDPPKVTLPVAIQPATIVGPQKESAKPVKPAPEPIAVMELSTRSTGKSKPEIKVDPRIVPRTPKDVADARARAAEEEAKAVERAQARAAAEARQQAIRKFSRSLDGAASSLSDNLSQGTTVEMPGPGGAAYANYGQAIKSIYDAAWVAPTESAGDATSVQVEVVVARDGSVMSDRIVKRSLDTTLDRSVQKALDRVRAGGLPPFPEGSRDTRRIFIINFNLKDKLGAG